MTRARTLLISMLVIGMLPSIGYGQFNDGDILISEFFSDFYSIDAENRTQTNILDAGLSVGSLVASGNSIFFQNGGTGLAELDLGSNTITQYLDGPASSNEIVFDQSNNLVLAGNEGVIRFNTQSQTFSTITTDSYDDVVVSAQGDIFVVDAFDGLGRLDEFGNFDFVADPGFAFDGLTIASDGFLYAYSGFDGLFQINPLSGQSTQLLSDDFIFFDDMTSFEDGLLISTAFDIDNDGSIEDGLYFFDIETGAISSLLDEATDDLSFWSPIDVHVVGELNNVVPEPTALPILLVAFVGAFRRHRNN